MFKTMNLTMLTDFYEITMANGYLEAGIEDEIAYFDMFFATSSSAAMCGQFQREHQFFHMSRS